MDRLMDKPQTILKVIPQMLRFASCKAASMWTRRLCIALTTAAFSQRAFASYNDGDFGVYLLMFSAMVGVVVLIITLIMVYFGQFKKGAVLITYSITLFICAFSPVLFALSDPKSVRILLIGESALLAVLLLPAVIQYFWWQRKGKPGC